MLIPSNNCCICLGEHLESKGKRLVRTAAKGVRSYPPLQQYLNELSQSTKSHVCANGVMVAISGELQPYTSRILAEANRSLHSWFCQQCANRCCEVCNTPYEVIMACDVIYPDGDVRHCGIYPISIQCQRISCRRFSKSQPVVRLLKEPKAILTSLDNYNS